MQNNPLCALFYTSMFQTYNSVEVLFNHNSIQHKILDIKLYRHTS